MKIIATEPFKKDFQKLPDQIKRHAEKALRLLMSNPHHPSLGIKKVKGDAVKGFDNVFEGRITHSYRFFFLIETDAYILLCCGDHGGVFKVKPVLLQKYKLKQLFYF